MFVDKLNKKQSGVYIIEEEKNMVNGVWEGILDHDNVNHQTIYIYTGQKLAGERVDNYFISTPSETPWKTHVKVFSKSEKVYIIYESLGDQVEADDINLVQDSLVEEINRAIAEENRIDDKLGKEIERSTDIDNVLNEKINDEIERSEAVDNELNNRITDEINRSKEQDQITNTNLINEVNRAKDEENKLKQNILNEETRAIKKENEISSSLNLYKDSNDIEIQKLKEKDNQLEKNKADKAYVDAELSKKYNKDEVFTKEEVLQKIEEIIDAAPDALDTLGKLAEALDNDPNFATNIINLLSTKVDKVEGRGLSDENYTLAEKNKVAGVEQGANKFIHPSTHSADMIVESSNKRFVSDAEKNNWNSKETQSGAKDKADTAEANAKIYTDNHANNAVKHIASNERTNWDDANSKKHVHSNKSVIDKITQALIDAWNSAVEHISDGIRHITSTERTKWNNKADKTYVDNTFATKQEMGNAGYGDMFKSIYDKNNNGKIDVAEVADKVPWSGITEKPSTFIPSKHTHNKSEITDFPTKLPADGGIADKLSIVDTRNDDSPPSYYFNQGRNMFWEFKSRTSVGNPPLNASASSIYAFILTITGWSNSSGGYPVQISVGDKNIAIRQGTSTSTWGNWFVIPNVDDIPTKISQLQNDAGYLKSLPSHNHDALYMKKGPLTWNDLKGV